MKSLSTSSLAWIECVLSGRFGSIFTLRENELGLILSVRGQHKYIFFDNLEPAFRRSRSDFSCQWWNASAENFAVSVANIIPAPSEGDLPNPLVEYTSKGAIVHYDILGLTYWMLTRLEEIGRTDLDEHQRFPATSSHAFQHRYLERPIVDEWLHVLGQVIEKVWPDLILSRHKFSVRVSHDVDLPARYAFKNFRGLVRTMAGDILIRKSIVAALNAPKIWLHSKHSIYPSDPLNNFDWLMRQSEENDVRSAFYFICGRTDPTKDALYDPEMPHIRELMREIHQRGHELGLHPSYHTYLQKEEIAKEADRLWKVCAEEGIQQNEWGGRMHYLRWDQSITPKALADSDMDYDSTLGYADSPGFRCGTCFEYQAFDVQADIPLSLRIIPLVAMDCTVISKKYLGLGFTEAAYEKFNELKINCQKVGGTFTLLWHNSFFNSPKAFEIYRRLLS